MPRIAQPYRLVSVRDHPYHVRDQPYQPGVYRRALDQAAKYVGNLLFSGADAISYIVAKQAGMPIGRHAVSRSCRQITNDVVCEMANDVWRGLCGTVQLVRRLAGQYPDYAALAAGVALL